MGKKRKLRALMAKRGLVDAPALVVCVGKRCAPRERSRALVDDARAYVARAGAAVRVEVVGCLRVCEKGPIAATFPTIELRKRVDPERARAMIDGLARRATPAASAPARLSLVILAVSDLARASRFYRDVFGWSAAVEVPVYVELAPPDGARLGLYARDAFVKNTHAPTSPRLDGHTTATEVYVTVDDLDAAVARLEGAGAARLSPTAPRPWGDTAAYYEDPDGNVVVVARRTAS